MDWMTMLNQMLDIILPAAASLVAIWFGILGNKMKAAYLEKVNSETKKNVVQTTVEYVEQVYKDIHGEAKLNKAIKRASEILNEKGITVSETELKTLIESAVYGLMQGWTIDDDANDTYTLTETEQDTIEEAQIKKEA